MSIVYYMDNFRGFQNTLISFEQVNFLVGENSTGKTSVIKLFSLLNNSGFSFVYDFNMEDTNLGSFEDIRSKSSTSKYFSIGQFQESEHGRKLFFGNIMKFKNENGSTVFYENILFSDMDMVYLRPEKSSVRYTRRHMSHLLSSGSLIEKAEKCVNYIRNSRFRADKLKLHKNSEFKTTLPIPILLSMLFDKVEELKDFQIKSYYTYMGTENVSLMAPIRAKPKPIYMSLQSPQTPEGDHTPFIFKSLSESNKGGKLNASLNAFGKASGLFDSIEVRPFGKSKISPFELDVIKHGKKYQISSVGYGISQIFPILIDILSHPRGTIFAIQQPEVHLHPKAQAAFGELLYYIASTDHKRFIIETHSDYLIDRFRHTIYRNQNKLKSKVLFFENINAANIIHDININDDGTYPAEQPINFRDFFINESIKLMEI